MILKYDNGNNEGFDDNILTLADKDDFMLNFDVILRVQESITGSNTCETHSSDWLHRCWHMIGP